MASNAQIQTVRAEFLDPSLYNESSASGVPRLSRGSLLAALSRAFDLAEGRRPGHAQRVAYVGVYLAGELGLDAARIEEVYFACLLHDAGMAAATSTAPRLDPTRGAKMIAGNSAPVDVLNAGGEAKWSEVLEALTQHSDVGAKIARKLGLGESVARAVASHHDCWDGSGLTASGERASVVSRVVAVADRVESIIDAESSPLLTRRRGPQLVREMAGSELDPDIADRMATLACKDDFWLGFFDNDLAGALMALNYGGILGHDELFDFLGVVTDVIDARNGRDPGRGRRVADLSYRTALLCDMTERRADLVRAAALLQDIGTLGVPVTYLSKPDILTIEEMSAVQMHPSYARDILSEVPGLGGPAWWVGCHHERIDGKGYPGMLEGDEVPAEAQIIGMCEAYEALTSERPYRRAMSPADAMEVMQGLAGTRFSPHLVERFESVVANEPE